MAVSFEVPEYTEEATGVGTLRLLDAIKESKLKGYNKKTGRLLIDIDPRYFRPAEVDLLHGDSSKAEKELGWKREVDFLGLISMMMNSDMRKIAGMTAEEYLAKKEATID